jgi:hypothetical protein
MTLKRRVPEAVYKAKRWYDYRPLKRFMVAGSHSSGGKVVENGIWEGVFHCVSKGWGRKVDRIGKENGHSVVREVPKDALSGKA